jgi:hypothetical protein
MFRKFLFSAEAILLLSSGAFAAIGQAQGFSINALNEVKRIGGVGSAEGGNMVMVGHGQEAYDACCGRAAIQEETAMLTQSASAVGIGGKTAVLEKAAIDGLQGQLIGRGSRAEGQALRVSLDTIVHKAGGIGSAVGAQGFVGAQNQIEVTPGRINTGSQVVGAAQFAVVSGGPGSNVMVKNAIDVKLAQGHIVSGGSAPPPCGP